MILLGFIWIGPPAPPIYYPKVVLAATGLLFVLFAVPWLRRGLRRNIVYVPVLIVLATLFFWGFADASDTLVGEVEDGLIGFFEMIFGWQALKSFVDFLFQQSAFREMAFMVYLRILCSLAVLFPLVLLILSSVVWDKERGRDTPGDPYRRAIWGVLVPLLLPYIVLHDIVAMNGLPHDKFALAYVSVPFLLHFYVFWPRKRWFSRALWMFLIVLGGLRGLTFATIGVLWTVWDFARACLHLGDPAVRGFFLGDTLSPAMLYDVMIQKELLTGLGILEETRGYLAFLVAIIFPPLVGFRATGGRPCRFPGVYAIWCFLATVGTLPLWGVSSASGPILSSGAFVLARDWPYVLLIQTILSAAFFASVRSAGGSTYIPRFIRKTMIRVDRPPRWKRTARFVTESILIPFFCIAIIAGALLEEMRASYLNKISYILAPRYVAPRPGQVSVVEILASEPRSIQWGGEFSKGFDSGRYPMFTLEQDQTMPTWVLLPNEADCRTFLAEMDRPEIRSRLETYERIAAADLLGQTTPLIARRDSPWPFFLVARIVNARVSVRLSRGQWSEAFDDIGRHIRFGWLLSTEGSLGEMFSSYYLRGFGVRCAYVALNVCPDSVQPEFLEHLRSLDPLVQRCMTPETIEAAEPGLRWPDRFFLLHRHEPDTLRWRAAGELCHVAEFRLIQLACAAKVFRAENGRLPGGWNDLRPLFDGALPGDPITGDPFAAEFTAKTVRFSTGDNSLPSWFDVTHTVFGEVTSRTLTVKIDAKGDLVE